MILDVTAGNRAMWRDKRPPNVVFLDVEHRLAVPPDVVADSRRLPFRDGIFDTVVFDPPHAWGKKPGAIVQTSPKRSLIRSRVKRNTPSYYGWDKYRTRRELISYIHQTLKEARRVLKPDGVLWFKWCDIEIEIERLAGLFTGWKKMMELQLKSHVKRETPTHFIMFRPLEASQKLLSEG